MTSHLIVAGARSVHLREATGGSSSTCDAAASNSQARIDPSESLRLVMMGPALDVMGGVSTVERNILESLPSSVAATHIATMEDGGKLRKTIRFAHALLEARRIFATRPDLVHIHFASRASNVRKMFVARMALKRNVPVLMHAHGAYYHEYWHEMKDDQRARTQRVLRDVQGLIVLGSFWKDFFVSVGVPEHKVCVLPNPVTIPNEVPSRANTSVVHAVFLGIMGQRKGAFDLIAAVARLTPRVRSRLRLVMAGNGETERARALVAESGIGDCVEIRDWLDARQRDELLANSQLFMLPSYHEGLPMAMLEAMAWGIAPICSPVGSVSEVITHQRNGMLVPPGNVDALAQAISELVLDDRKRAAMAASARISVEPLSVHRYIERLMAIYSAAAQRRSIAELSVPCKH